MRIGFYGDFYQLDLEKAFVESGEEVRTEMEVLIKDLVKNFAGKKLLSEEIPRIPYEVAMENTVVISLICVSEWN